MASAMAQATIFLANQNQAAGKPAPVLQPDQPGRWRMFRDLGWLPGVIVRLAPRQCALVAGIALALGLLVPAQLWLTKALVDALARQVKGGQGRDTFLWLGLLVASLLVERALGGVQPWLQAATREAIGPAMKERVMRKAAGLDLAAFEHQGYFDQLNRVIADAETRPPQLLQQVLQALQLVPQFLGYGLALLTLSRVLPLIVLAAVIPTQFVFMLSGQTNWSLLSVQTRDRRLADYYARLLTDRPVAKEVRLYGLAGYLQERWSTLFWQTRNEQRRMALRLGLRQRASVLGTTVVSLLGLWWVVSAHLLQTTASGYALLFQSIQGMMSATFNLALLMQALGESSGYASAFRAFLGTADEETSRRGDEGRGAEPSTVPSSVTPHPWSRSARQRPSSPHPFFPSSPSRPFPHPIRQGIRFEDVWFTYPGSDRPALAGVGFMLGAGEKVALVGENGAGKTTITKLLLGLYRPDQGRITVDGVDLREIDPAAVRAAMSAVFQQFVRYQLTFAENVALGAPDRLSDRQGVTLAVGQAGATDIVQGLPEGLDTLLGPDVGGVDLSGGQWQRVALARAFFREAQVLVLDEPTAALDPLAELALFERFATLAEGKSALLVSHRLGMARLADRILVLAGGKVVEAGTHAALVQAGGQYAELFEAQARWYR
jgi:ATP-binding cassette, subfamily B, bacterial